MIARCIAVLLAVCMLGACSAGALDGFSGGEEETDGGGDGGAANESGSTGAEPGPNGFNDTFESDSLCTPWNAYRASLSASAPGHTGSASCKACTTAVANSGGMRRTFRPTAPATTLPAGQYSFTAWVRGAPYTGTIGFELYGLTATNGKGAYIKGTPTGTTVSGEWTALQIEYAAPAPVTGWFIDLYIDNSPPVNSCFSADDVTLTYLP